MASNDIRDIMNVARSNEARPAKKQKVSAQAKKDQYAGMSKEVRGLMMGDGVPPVQVQESRYKTKPKIAKRPHPWIKEAFTNPGRTDGLVLNHWVRGGNAARPDTPGGTGAPVTPADSKVDNDGYNKPMPTVQSNYYFSKFNTKPTGPSYTNEEYEQHLTSDDWSKEETDYLVELALDFDLRWIVIWDRYDFKPKETKEGADSMAVTVEPKQRTMEEMKARYYEVSAKIMTIHHPLSSMSTAEFDLHEKMLKFDPKREASRKKLAEALLARSPDELREEEVLLGELKRIVDNEDRFVEERRELYARLDHPQSNGNIAIYESSQGLIQLMQNLLATDKNKKRRSIAGPEGTNATPTQTSQTQNAAASGQGNRASIGGSSNKKGASGVQPKQLSQRDEIRFGITHHDRLSSGVTFRQARVEKLVLAKSAAQQQKLHDALGQLRIGIRAHMPTHRVCSEYENLIQSVNNLMDARKVSEKTNNEIRVLQSQKVMRERKERGEEDTEPKEEDGQTKLEEEDEEEQAETQAESKPESDNEDNDEDDDNQDKDENEDGDGDEDEDNQDEDEAEVDDDQGDNGEDDDMGEPEVEDSIQDDGEQENGDDAEEEVEEPEEPEEEEAPITKATLSHKRSASVLSMASEKSSKKARK